MMLAGHIAVAAREVRARLEAQFPERLHRVVVFGSTARGTATEMSDVDLLLIVDRLATGERARIMDTAVTVGFERELRIVPLVMSKDQWAELERRELLLPREIARDGVAI
jgi:predicted nucleotidyltransferase